MSEATGSGAGDASGLTLEQLARTVGMTPRNVRAYQTRGLVHPPTVRGRTGFYDGTHVSRLLLVQELQARGLNLAAVRALLDSRQVVTWLFHDVRARGRRGVEVEPVRLPAVSVARLRALDPDAPEELCRHGVLRRQEDGGYTADKPVFMAALHLVEAGVPLADVVRLLLEVGREARRLAREVGRTLVRHAGEERPGVARGARPGGRDADGPSDDDRDRLVPYAVQMCVAELESLLAARVPEEVDRRRPPRGRQRARTRTAPGAGARVDR